MGQQKTVLVFGATNGSEIPVDDDDESVIDGPAMSAGSRHNAKFAWSANFGTSGWYGYLVTDETTVGYPLDLADLAAEEGSPLVPSYQGCRCAWEALRDQMAAHGVDLPAGKLLLVDDYECA